MPPFKWNEKSNRAAVLLAKGKTQHQAAGEIGTHKRTLIRWLATPEFSAEVDRLSARVDIAGRTQRLRLCMRAARQKIKDDGTVDSQKDLLDWLKFAQSETEDIKLDLTTIAEASAAIDKL